MSLEFINAEYQLKDGTVHSGFVPLVRYLVDQAVEKRVEEKKIVDVEFLQLAFDEFIKKMAEGKE